MDIKEKINGITEEFFNGDIDPDHYIAIKLNPDSSIVNIPVYIRDDIVNIINGIDSVMVCSGKAPKKWMDDTKNNPRKVAISLVINRRMKEFIEEGHDPSGIYHTLIMHRNLQHDEDSEIYTIDQFKEVDAIVCSTNEKLKSSLLDFLNKVLEADMPDDRRQIIEQRIAAINALPEYRKPDC